MGEASVDDGDELSDRLEDVIAEYVHLIESGRPIDRDAFLAKHPDLADDLRDFFAHRDRMEQLLDPIQSSISRMLQIRCPHCFRSIELMDNEQLSSIDCSSCGRSFSLVDHASTNRPSGLKRIGQFQLIEVVGVGQFGTVWKARDLSLERTVAVKIPRHRQLSEAEVELFLRDARVSAQLKHPNIVGVHEVGKHQDMIYMVSDFIQGASLKDWLSAKPLSFDESAELCVTIAKALHYAHESGVVHRDLKPSNIMMDMLGTPHIVDFGLAKRDLAEVTMTIEGQVLGTPAYMSPEQARGHAHDVDGTADIYAMGVILFELLTHELPFRGDTRTLLVQILDGVPPSPRSLNSSVPRDLETICLKCLEKEPHRRYRSAHAFAEDCERYLNRKPVVARPISRLTHSWRWCLRNRLSACLLFMIATLLIGISVVTTVGQRKVQLALAIAEHRAETIEQNLYFAEMNQAGVAALDVDGIVQVRELLGNWLPKKNQVDRRGWEWHYLDSRLHEEFSTLQAHKELVSSIAWSPDGDRIATGSDDRSIKIWNQDGELIHALADHQDKVQSIDWNQDGSRIAAACLDGRVVIWDAIHGKIIKEIQHDGQSDGAFWSHDDQFLAVSVLAQGSENQPEATVTIWSTSTWAIEKTFGPISTHSISLDWNPSRSQIAIGSAYRVRIWEPTLDEPEFIEGSGSVAWNHDGSQLAIGSIGRINIWNVVSRERVTSFNSIGGTQLKWSPNSALLAYGARRWAVKIRNLNKNQTHATLSGHQDPVTTVCWHPSGNFLATGCTDGSIKIWESFERPRMRLGSGAIAWAPDGSRYVTRQSNTVLVCNLDSDQPVLRLEQHEFHVHAVSWSPDGSRIASASVDGEVCIWNSTTGDMIHSLKSQPPDLRYGSPMPARLAWSPAGKRLAFLQTKSVIRIVDVDTAETIHDLKGHTQTVRTLAWSPDGAHLVSGGYEQTFFIWNPNEGTLKKTVNLSSVNAVCWSPDNKRVAVAAADQNVYIVDVLTGMVLRRLFGHATHVHTVSWHPDGQRIATADESGGVRIWDADTGQQTLSLSYPEAVPMVAWSPDGQLLAGVAFGGWATVKIWDANNARSVGKAWLRP